MERQGMFQTRLQSFLQFNIKTTRIHTMSILNSTITSNLNPPLSPSFIHSSSQLMQRVKGTVIEIVIYQAGQRGTRIRIGIEIGGVDSERLQTCEYSITILEIEIDCMPIE